ncbi:MAG TPA: hypothetical protein VFD70_16150, partial [Anaerolineae bacterium]|nr:hypothetical protein [Anaerolineae bacterium]
MGENLDYLRMFVKFPFSLHRFMQHPLTLEEARQIVRERMEHREEIFLRTVERTIYGYPRSPYLPLLKMAGCELGDLRECVRHKGVEGALRELRESGVYVSFQELKGRAPIVRNGLTMHVTQRDFDNPYSSRDLMNTTGGSTGAASNLSVDLDHIAANAPHRMLTLAAHGLLDAPTAIWQGILPAPGLRLMLYFARTGKMPERWFSPLGGRDSRHWLKYRLSTYYFLAWMRLEGLDVPFPEHVRVDDALIIARWAAEAMKQHSKCVIRAGVSRGVRICLAA